MNRTNTQGVSKMQKKIFKSPLGFEVEHEVEEPNYNFQQKRAGMFVKEYDTNYEYQETPVQRAFREAGEKALAQSKLQEKTA